MKAKRSFIPLTKHDIGLVLGIGTLAAILNVYPYPLLAAAAVVIGIILLRFSEPQKKPEERIEADTVEKRSAEEIITSKLQAGAIEQAIDQRFDKMVEDIVNELFGSYGDITKDIQHKLRDTMSPYIEKYDFGKYNTKLEHLLNELLKNVTQDQHRLVQNIRDIMGIEPVNEFSTSELFEEYTKHIAKHINTDHLEIDYDDRPTYQPLNVHMRVVSERSHSSLTEIKRIQLTCEEDEEVAMTIEIKRWTDSVLSNDWRINRITRSSSDGDTIFAFQTNQRENDIASLDLPMNNLRHLNQFEVFLLKLHYDKTSIIIDETHIIDNDVEVEVEPDVFDM